jgi:hypothetical protein
MEYYLSTNTGKGFITHSDNERSHISEYPGGIFVTEANSIWATRVGATTKTKEEAQAIVDAAILGQLHVAPHPNAGEQIVVTLP